MAVPRITKDELKLRLDAGGESLPVLVDVRLKYPYEHSTATLPSALRMLPTAIDLGRLPRERDIVLYDSDPGELVSSRIAEELRQQGYRVSVLEGGIGAWLTAKYPTDSKSAPQPSAPATAKG